MALFDEWKESQRQHSDDEEDKAELNPKAASTENLAEATDDSPIFHLDKLDWKPTREQGTIVSMAAGSNVLLIGTSNNCVTRWNVETDECDEIVISRKNTNDERIYKVFMDPTGSHGIIGMDSGQVYYIHSRKKDKALLCTKIKNVVIESVAWNNAAGNEGSTKSILIGSNRGQIYEALIEEKDKVFKKVYDLSEGDTKPTPISGLRIEVFPFSGGKGAGATGPQAGPAGPSAPEDFAKYFVMAATPIRHYQFVGGPTFEAMFGKYERNPAFVELPGDLGYSELRFFSKFQSKSKAAASETCGWLTGAGIYYANLVFGSQDERVVEDGDLFPYPEHPNEVVSASQRDVVGGNVTVVPPVSLALTEFHFIILTKKRLTAINRLSQEPVFEELLDPKTYGEVKGLAPDPRKDTIWMYTDRFLYEVEVEREERDVWKLFLSENKFEDALKYCESNPFHREQVLNAQADHYFQIKSYQLAAKTYAKTQRSFEEVTLKFVNTSASASSASSDGGASSRNALKTYLQSKLSTLQAEDRTQFMVICTWLTEIFLDNLNSLRDPGAKPDANARKAEEAELEQFHDFLDNYSDCLNKEMTVELMSSHGRVEELLYYAKITENIEFVINHLIANDKHLEALELLREQEQPAKLKELFYKFAPTLMHARPKETVDAFIKTDCLAPSKLIPALMRYQPKRGESSEAIRYLEHCIKVGSQDPAIHNYLFSLYVKLPDPGPLLNFIENHKTHPHYDYKYALRLCTEEGNKRACVAIYRAMKMSEEAVRLALEKTTKHTPDVALAKKVVQQAEDLDTDQKKRLWLIIARHVIQTEGSITDAMAILKECKPLLKLEDILPYFPDFVTIGQFKEEICKSLESYNEGIRSLKDDMKDFTDSANLIRKDIYELRNRSGFVTANQKCDLCRHPVLTRQFFLFPCTHVFHVDCVATHVNLYLEKHPEEKEALLVRGRKGSDSDMEEDDPEEREARRAPGRGGRGRELELKVLEDYAASECPFCGHIMIESVQDPFIKPDEEQLELQSWAI